MDAGFPDVSFTLFYCFLTLLLHTESEHSAKNTLMESVLRENVHIVIEPSVFMSTQLKSTQESAMTCSNSDVA